MSSFFSTPTPTVDPSSSAPSGSPTLEESQIHFVSASAKIFGKMEVSGITRFHGMLEGELISTLDSQLILGETSEIKGKIEGDVIWVDGFVEGEISAKTRIVISRKGRVLGNLNAPTLQIEAGAYFSGKAKMENEREHRTR